MRRGEYNKKMKFQCKEHVIWFMLGRDSTTLNSGSTPSINLSHYDYSFMVNMQSLTHDKKEITSNQADLFNKLIHKYRKQLSTKGITEIENLVALPWQCKIVPSLPKFTNANVDFDKKENLLTIQVPFKKEFINKFRSTRANPWEWNSNKKRYESTPTTIALLVAYTRLPKFFTTVYHNEVNTLITQLEKEKSTKTYWDPTLTLSDGEYKVVSSNTILDELLTDIKLDNSPQCLYKMSQLGINIDEDILGDDAKLKFASESMTEVDLDDFNTCLEWISELKCDTFYFGTGLQSRPDIDYKVSVEVRNAVMQHDIQIIPFSPSNTFSQPMETPIKSNHLPMFVQMLSSVDTEVLHGNSAVGKIIILKNKRPVEVT